MSDGTLCELAALWQTRPAVVDPADVVAAWYVAKGRLHERTGRLVAADHLVGAS